MRFPTFIGSTDRAQCTVANSGRTVNWYAAIMERGSKNEIILLPTPGQASFTTLADIGSRAALSMNDRTFWIMATGVYEIFPTASTSKYGTVAQDNNPAVITTNGTGGQQAFISSGGNGYCLDLTNNNLTTELTGDATQVGMLDGYFIAFDRTTSRIRLSDLNDGTTWDPTQFAARSAAPDNWQAMIVNPPDIWLIGSLSGDVWYDAGTFPFPFAPRPGATFKYGTPATFSIANAGDSVLWLSQNTEGAGIVVQARGYTPQPISTPAVEAAIARYQRESTITDAEAFAYQQEGHTFYVLRFPSAKATWVYDLTTGFWHERMTWISATNTEDVWHPRVHTQAFGKHLVGDQTTGQISVMDVTTGTESDGSAIKRIRVTPSLFNEDKQVLIRTLEIFLEMGLGTSTGQGSDPMLFLESSDDGGKTYGNARQGSVGKIGEYKRRLRFSRMGIPRDRVYRLTASDPISAWRVIDAYINNESSASSG